MDKNLGLDTTADKNKWLHNLALFLAPVAIIYLGAVSGLLQIEGHRFSLKDLIPSEFTWGAIVLYVVNSIMDYMRKFMGAK